VVDGAPVTAAATGASAAERDAPQATSSYRPGYELVAEQILRLIVERKLRPGDRMPTPAE